MAIDTRSLLNQIIEFRQKLEAMPKLQAGSLSKSTKPGTGNTFNPEQNHPSFPRIAQVSPPSSPISELEESLKKSESEQEKIQLVLRHFENPENQLPTAKTPTFSTHQSRDLLQQTHTWVKKLRAIQNHPWIHYPQSAPLGTDHISPILKLQQDNLHWVQIATIVLSTLPASPSEQVQRCLHVESVLKTVERNHERVENALQILSKESDQVSQLTNLIALLMQEQKFELASWQNLCETIIQEQSNDSPFRWLQLPFLAEVPSGNVSESVPVLGRVIAAHSIMVARVVARLFYRKQIGKSSFLDAILASLLHDVGMLEVAPENWYHPNNKLRIEQKRAIENHVPLGLEKLAKAFNHPEILSAIADHHERMDGTGYPSGKLEDQIPPLARLLGIVDSFVSMVSARPYRPPIDPRTALTDTLMIGEQGILDKQLTPTLVDLTFYPIGSVVELLNGSIGIVIASHYGKSHFRSAIRPVIQLLTDENKNRVAVTTIVDLAEIERDLIIRTIGSPERNNYLYPDHLHYLYY